MASIPNLRPPGGHTLERADTGIYKLGNLVVAPGATDKVLAHAYLRFDAEGLLPVIFAEQVPSVTWFLSNYMKMQVLSCFEENSGRLELLGLGWANNITALGPEQKKAEIGMAFFRTTQPKLVLAEMMVEWAFKELELVAVFGTTPEPHRVAVVFTRQQGFEMFGPIPGFTMWEGKICSAWISAMTRERWQARRKSWEVTFDEAS